jgi:ribonuclease P protein component
VTRPGAAPEAPRFRLVTIRRAGEIERASRQGRTASSPLFLVACLATPGWPPRLAIKASRRLGGAVVRNRIRRQVKEIMRVLFPLFDRACDCVVIPRAAAPGAPFARKRADLAALLARIGYLAGAAATATRRRPARRAGAP